MTRERIPTPEEDRRAIVGCVLLALTIIALAIAAYFQITL